MNLIYHLIFNVIFILIISILIPHNHLFRVTMVCFTVSVCDLHSKYAGGTMLPNIRAPLSPHAGFKKVK